MAARRSCSVRACTPDSIQSDFRTLAVIVPKGVVQVHQRGVSELVIAKHSHTVCECVHRWDGHPGESSLHGVIRTTGSLFSRPIQGVYEIPDVIVDEKVRCWAARS